MKNDTKFVFLLVLFLTGILWLFLSYGDPIFSHAGWFLVSMLFYFMITLIPPLIIAAIVSNFTKKFPYWLFTIMTFLIVAFLLFIAYFGHYQMRTNNPY